MKIVKAFALFSLTLIFFNANSQFEISTGIGLNSTIPLKQRDTFSGSQTFAFSVIPKFSINKNLKVVNSIKPNNLKITNNNDASEVLWQSATVGLGGEYLISKNKDINIFLMLNYGFLYKYGKNILSQNSSSGYSFIELKPNNKFVQNTEIGFFYYPHDFVMVKGSYAVPMFYKNEKYPYPSSLELSIFYNYNFSKKQNKKNVESNPHREFCQNLQIGKLYILEDRKDTVYLTLRRAFAEKYHFSKYCFIDDNELKTKLDSFAASTDFKNIFIAKTGTIVYDIGRAATNGIIIYNYLMQNPIDDEPFFVRNRSSDVNFKHSGTANKIVNKLNKALFNNCSTYKN